MVQTDAEGRLKRGQRVMIEGWVWCHEHGTVHEDTTDPYDYGEPDCTKEEHRPIAWTAKAGDYR